MSLTFPGFRKSKVGRYTTEYIAIGNQTCHMQILISIFKTPNLTNCENYSLIVYGRINVHIPSDVIATNLINSFRRINPHTHNQGQAGKCLRLSDRPAYFRQSLHINSL